MHSATLDTAAAILLLSSLGSLGLLVKRTPRARLASSTTALSVSDILSSLLTALMVFFHHFYVSNGDAWSSEVDYAIDSNAFESRRSARNATDSEGHTAGACDLKAVFFQYALFFVPFVNAFLSLLNFSFNCYASAKELDGRCCDAEKNLQVDSTVAEAGAELPTARQRLIKPKSLGRRYGGLALLGQWLLPAVFTGAFHLGEPPLPGEDPVCVVAANFPLESCAQELQDKILSTPTSVHSYISSEDNLLWTNPNSSDVDDVVKRVYHVVQAALNESMNSTSGGSELVDVAEDYGGEVLGVQLNSNLIQRRMYSSADDYLKPYFSNSDEDEKILMMNDMQVSKCTNHRCTISTKFLKIYLFALLILIYFVPILLSSLFLVASYYKCQAASSKLNDTKTTQEAKPKDEEASSEEETSKSPPGVDETICALVCEADKVRGFFRVFKLNAAVAVATWTPFFLQIISKVFFCGSVPRWLTEVAFLATVGFAVFRNALNLSVVRLDAESYRKRNSVHPNN